MKKHLLSSISHQGLTKAVTDLNTVLRLAPENTERARNIVESELRDVMAVLSEFKPESFNDAGSYDKISDLDQQLTSAAGILLDYRVNSYNEMVEVLPESVVFDQVAKKLKVFESSHLDGIVESYVDTEQDYRDSIEYFDKAMECADASPEKFVSEEMSRQRLLLRKIADQLYAFSIEAHHLKKQLIRPEKDLPGVLATYESVRKIAVEQMGFDDLARPEGHSDCNLLRNKSNIVSALKDTEALFNSINETVEEFNNYDYESTDYQAGQLRRSLEGASATLLSAIGENTKLSAEINEFKGLFEDCTENLLIIENNCVDLKFAMNEIIELSDVGISGQPLYDEGNTDWYSMYFDEGTEKYTQAESVIELNRHHQEVVNKALDDVKFDADSLSSAFTTLKESVVREIKAQSVEKGQSLDM